jgi:hypothetical protein
VTLDNLLQDILREVQRKWQMAGEQIRLVYEWSWRYMHIIIPWAPVPNPAANGRDVTKLTNLTQFPKSIITRYLLRAFIDEILAPHTNQPQS